MIRSLRVTCRGSASSHCLTFQHTISCKRSCSTTLSSSCATWRTWESFLPKMTRGSWECLSSSEWGARMSFHSRNRTREAINWTLISLSDEWADSTQRSISLSNCKTISKKCTKSMLGLPIQKIPLVCLKKSVWTWRKMNSNTSTWRTGWAQTTLICYRQSTTFTAMSFSKFGSKSWGII